MVGHIEELLGNPRLAILNLFAGWGVLESQCSMK